MQRTAIPLGGNGLIVGTGLFETRPAALEDIRNVSLRPGRTARRGGLYGVASFVGATDVIGIHPLRALGVTAVVTYHSTTRVVALHVVAPDYTARLVGTIWTLAAGVPFPKVSLADVWDKLIIAHDEPSYGLRRETRYYEFTPVENIFDLIAQLNANSAGPAPIKFRGVCQYLTYLVGWGYGTEPSTVPPPDTENDRPEIVRISLPDDPLAFKPEHYFICGQRADPVNGCWLAGDVLAARKGSSSYTIFGSDRPSFGIVQSDSLFGVASSRLAVTVGAVNYFWSFDGPRRSTGRASDDQAIPLDLYDFGLSDPTLLSFDDAFACYDPVERVVLFVFGTLVYCFHTEVEQWSLRDYPFNLFAGGIFVRDSAGAGLGPTADTDFSAARVNTPTSAATVPGQVDVTVTGALLGGEVLQVWGRPRNVSGATWQVLGNKTPVVLGLNTCDVVYPKLGVTWDLATRLTISGVAGAAYRNSDPTAWPLLSQGTVLVALPTIAPRTVSGTTGYFETRPIGEANIGAMVLLLDAPDLTETHLTYELRSAPAGGAYGADAATAIFTASGGRATRVGIDAVRHTQRDIQVRVRSAELTGAWVQMFANVWMGPLGYFGAVVDREPTGQYRWILTAPAEPAYAVDSGVAHLQYKIGAGAFTDDVFFSFSPSQPEPGFASLVFTSTLFAGRSNTESQFQARRELTAQGQTFYSIYFTPIFPT